MRSAAGNAPTAIIHPVYPARTSAPACTCCLTLFCCCWRASSRLKIPPCRCDVILVDVRRKQEFPECKHGALNICRALALLARPDLLLARSSSPKLQLCWTPLLSTALHPPPLSTCFTVDGIVCVRRVKWLQTLLVST